MNKKFLSLLYFLVLIGIGYFVIISFKIFLPTSLRLVSSTVNNFIATSTISEADLSIASSIITRIRPGISSKKILNWKTPSSSQAGVPIVVNTSIDSSILFNFYIYNFNLEKLQMVGKNITFGEGDGGNNGLGGPVVSSDFLYTAYVNRKDQSLYILSNDTLEKRLIFQGKKDSIILLIGWSPDSAKIIFSILEPSGIVELAGPDYRTISYKIFNLSDGILTTVPFNAKIAVGGFLDNNHILVMVNVGGKRITTALDLKTFYLDHQRYDQKFGFINFVTEKNNPYASTGGSLSLDWSKFAYNVSKHGASGYQTPPAGLSKESESNVIYGDNNSKIYKILAKGRWGEYQEVLISPDGNKVAYDMAGPSFWVYDSVTGKTDLYNYNYDSVRILQWLDKDRLMFSFASLHSSTTAPVAYKVLDANTGFVKTAWSSLGK